ncbi:M24 family metallopeptidase [bacterium]|nr:M24 family metallopeptidase [bacterium]MBU4361652.1 M24 family metallopeptidase [bacterium]MCG2761730.1 M24 family metallopeptidase [Candidatus Atribacteria bacterium]
MDELKVKKNRIYHLLENKGLDGIILVKNSNIAWLTSGMENRVVFTNEEGAVRLIVLKDKILVLTNNIEAERVIKEEGLGKKDFQLMVNQWYEEDSLNDLISKYRLGADCYLPGVNNLQEEIKELRFSLLPGEIKKYRILGRETSQIMSKICKNTRIGETENEIRGRLAQKLWGKNINSHLILIGSDERIFAYRHPIPKDKKIRKYVMVVVCAEREGLIVNITRFVYFGIIPQELKEKLWAVAKVDASFILNTKIGVKVADIFQNAISAYKEVDYPDEWKLHHQGGATGYETRDYITTPDSPQIVQPNQAFAWNPSIKGAKSEDTILVTEKGYEIITDDPDWPKIEINYKGKKIARPAILQL